MNNMASRGEDADASEMDVAAMTGNMIRAGKQIVTNLSASCHIC